MVGIMRGGGAYVPLDPKLPVDRLRYLVEQCRCGVVVSQGKHVGVGGSLGVDVCVAEDVMWDEGVRVMPGHEIRCDRPESLAYVLFTSGSAGKPKGVMVQHDSLVTFVSHQSGPYRSASEERNWRRLYVLAYTFTDSVGVVWRTLACSATLVVGKPDSWLDPSYIVHLMAVKHVTSLWGVPSPFTLVMDAANDVLPKSLMDLHLSGEVPPDDV